MGCASSSPLVESGKNLVDNAKESAGEAIGKGEKAVQEVGDAVKEKFTSELGHVKEAMQSAMHTAENSIGSVMGKVGDTFNSTSDEIKTTLNNAEDEAEDALNVASDTATEAVSEAETVLASEADNIKESFTAISDNAKENVKEVLHIEDLDEEMSNIDDNNKHFIGDGLGDSVVNVEEKAEELVAKIGSPAASPKKKEEPPPTFWEAAADAVLHRSSFSKSIEVYTDNDPDKERILAELLLIEAPPKSDEDKKNDDEDTKISELTVDCLNNKDADGSIMSMLDVQNGNNNNKENLFYINQNQKL